MKARRVVVVASFRLALLAFVFSAFNLAVEADDNICESSDSAKAKNPSCASSVGTLQDETSKLPRHGEAVQARP